MRRIVLTFGLLSGAVVSGLMAVLVPLCLRGTVDFEHGEVIGYSSMVVAFLFVFFAIRSYRDGVGGGTIGFGRAFKVGILVTLVSCAVYVGTWQVVYHAFLPDFGDVYAAHVVDQMREDGASEAAVEEKRQQMARFQELYRNPLFNVAVTFLEIFPVGLVMTLVSAGILRRRTPAAPAPATA